MPFAYGFIVNKLMIYRNIDDVDKTMEEINEQTENMKQIQEALATPIGSAADFDEAWILTSFILRDVILPSHMDQISTSNLMNYFILRINYDYCAEHYYIFSKLCSMWFF